MLQPTLHGLRCWVGHSASRNRIMYLRAAQCNQHSYFTPQNNFSNLSSLQFVPQMPTATIIPNSNSSSFEKELNIQTPEIENGNVYPFYEIRNNNSSLQNLWNIEANEELQQSVKGDEQKSTSMECDSVKRKRRRKMKKHKHRKRLKATRPLRKKLGRL